MSIELKKPYTEKQYNDFIAEYGQNCNKNRNYTMSIKETETALHALEPNEIIQDNKVIINPDYGNQQLILAKQQRIAAIKQELIEIDAKTIRPLRAGEQDKVNYFEAQARTLRQEMKSLELEETQEFEEIGGLSLED